MKISNSRILAFLAGCILLRIILAIVAFYLGKYHSWLLQILGVIAIIMGISFLLIYEDIIGKASADKQLLVWQDDDTKMWWNDFRPIHGALYLLFGILALCKIELSYIVLVIDVTIGLTAWLIHHQVLSVMAPTAAAAVVSSS